MNQKQSPLVTLVFFGLAIVAILGLLPPASIAQSGGASSKIQGLVPNGTAQIDSVNPVAIGGRDATGTLRTAKVNSTGSFLASPGISSTDDTVVKSGRKTSNAGTAVAIAAAGTGSQRVYLAKLVVYNTSSTVFHTFQLISSGGTVLTEFDLSSRTGTTGAGGGAILDDTGFWQSEPGEGLSFKFTDGTGSAADLVLTAETVTK